MKVYKIFIFSLLLVGCTVQEPEVKRSRLDQLKISVTEDQNRAISFTNKESAYYYTQSHYNDHKEHAYFEGLTISQTKVFDGYNLFINGKECDYSGSTVDVYPHKMIRSFSDGLREEFFLFDHRDVIEISLSNENVGVELDGLDIGLLDGGVSYLFSLDSSYVVAVGSIDRSEVKVKNNLIYGSGGVVIVVGRTQDNTYSMLQDYYMHRDEWILERESRMENMLKSKSYNFSSDSSLSLALDWIRLTMDQLVTHQRGYGIYAGLPWFNEYWGRDQFIAMPGACLVNGEFDVAKNILLSFAQYQDVDPDSKYFGRVPNIVKTNSVNYHTTDGTPRFVIQLKEYLSYSGDTTIIEQLYDNVKYSIEGSLKNWIDKDGYLIHEDNETWMDARRHPDNVSYSPRDSRANDIQALWYKQLIAGVYFADQMEDRESSVKWQAVADKVSANFEKDFTDSDHDFIADHLDPNDYADYQLRPNQLFAFELIQDVDLKSRALKSCWESLVYPWGVASLDQKDPFFHKYHLSDDYHKDEAYHNGTIWLWLNGVAMERMIEMNQVDTAYKLFKNMNNQTLTMGVVGGLGENMDPYPHRGEAWPRLTGTYLQAWSNSEHLRVWYQQFLGVRPDMISNSVTLAPRIPSEIKDLESKVFVGTGCFGFDYKKEDDNEIYIYDFEEFSPEITIDIYPFEVVSLSVLSGNSIKLVRSGSKLELIVYNSHSKKWTKEKIDIAISDERIAKQRSIDKVLKGVKFATPNS